MRKFFSLKQKSKQKFQLSQHKNSLLEKSLGKRKMVTTPFAGHIMSIVRFLIRNEQDPKKPHQREVMVRDDVVFVLLYNPFTEEILLNYEHRAGAEVHLDVDPMFYDSCAGGIGEQESTQAAALREVEEETGIKAANKYLHPVSPFPLFTTPGGSSERAMFYILLWPFAFEEKKGLGVEKEGENIATVKINLESASEMCNSGKILSLPTTFLLQYVITNKTTLRKKAETLFD